MFKGKDISIIPIMVVVALLSFSVKIVDVYSGVNTLTAEAFAADDKKEDMQAEEVAETKDNSEIEEETVDEAEPPETKWRDSNDEDFGFNSVKMEHLQNLDERRKELDQQEKAIKAREALVMATQQEMERKYQELAAIRNQIEELLEKQSAQEEQEMLRLVKIYEGMKAKEAAAIFNTLDLDILVQVMGIMSERKASPILAKMNPERAKTVTIMLAERKTLPSLPMNQ